jgi:hypothetical protein
LTCLTCRLLSPLEKILIKGYILYGHMSIIIIL